MGLDVGYDELGDAELVGRIAAGDERALMTAYDRHGDTLFGIAVRFLGDREAAAEIVQEVFLSLWQRGHRFDSEAGSLVAWLIGIARHRSLDRLRAESRRPRIVRPAPGTGSAGSASMFGDGPPFLDGRAALLVDPSDPGAEVDRRWTRSVVRSTLAELPEAERHVLMLAYDDGLSQSEIATRLGMPIGTVKSRTRRAMAALRARLVTVPGLVDA